VWRGLAALIGQKIHLHIGLAERAGLPRRHHLRLAAVQARCCPKLEVRGQRVGQLRERQRRRGALGAVKALDDDMARNPRLRLG